MKWRSARWCPENNWQCLPGSAFSSTHKSPFKCLYQCLFSLRSLTIPPVSSIISNRLKPILRTMKDESTQSSLSRLILMLRAGLVLVWRIHNPEKSIKLIYYFALPVSPSARPSLFCPLASQHNRQKQHPAAWMDNVSREMRNSPPETNNF